MDVKTRYAEVVAAWRFYTCANRATNCITSSDQRGEEHRSIHVDT